MNKVNSQPKKVNEEEDCSLLVSFYKKRTSVQVKTYIKNVTNSRSNIHFFVRILYQIVLFNYECFNIKKVLKLRIFITLQLTVNTFAYICFFLTVVNTDSLDFDILLNRFVRQQNIFVFVSENGRIFRFRVALLFSVSIFWHLYGLLRKQSLIQLFNIIYNPPNNLYL